MFTICDCGAKVEYDREEAAICPICHRILFEHVLPMETPGAEQPDLPLADDVAATNEVEEREIIWVSATGKEYREFVSMNVSPDDSIGNTISVGGRRFKVKGWRNV